MLFFLLFQKRLADFVNTSAVIHKVDILLQIRLLRIWRLLIRLRRHSVYLYYYMKQIPPPYLTYFSSIVLHNRYYVIRNLAACRWTGLIYGS